MEHERKYLVVGESWRDEVASATRLTQGYIAKTPSATVRVRVSGEAAWLTVKGQRHGISNLEVESVINVDDALRMLQQLTSSSIAKTRYLILRTPRVWTVDVFSGQNSRLVMLEVEADTPFELETLPTWVGMEVSSDKRFTNAYLDDHPFNHWADEFFQENPVLGS